MNFIVQSLVVCSLISTGVSQNNTQYCVENPTGEVSLNVAVRGVPGPKGDTGDTGPVGPQSPKGENGSKGQKGSRGIEGNVGPIGPPGLEGPIGPRGHPGPDGTRGPQGQRGPPGARGPQGDHGDTILTEEEFNRVSNSVQESVMKNLNSSLSEAIQNVLEEMQRRDQVIENAVLGQLTLVSQTLNQRKRIVCKCGICGEWRKVILFDTTQGDLCPSNLRTVRNEDTNQTACGRTTSQGCTKLTFPVSDEYTNVCGRVRGYQFGSMDAFDLAVSNFAHIRFVVEGYYVDGISITHGQPLRHLWTYAVGFSEESGNYACPCRGGASPRVFVGSHYYCESAFPVNELIGRVVWEDPLWDGRNCISGNSCCDRYGWFHRQVRPSSDDIHVRLCSDQGIDNEDVIVDQLEIWVK